MTAMSKKKKKEKDRFYEYKNLLKNWDGVCCLCGCGFENLDSVTKEHLIPKSLESKYFVKHNGNHLAPTHWRCNNFRETKSLIQTALMLEEKKKILGDENFKHWVNASVPGRWSQHQNLR